MVTKNKMCFLSAGKDRIVITTREEIDTPCKANIVIEKQKEEPGKIMD